MSEPTKTLNDVAWEALFEKYDVLSHIDAEGKFVISASQIRAYREPRLMAKFDHNINLPHIFSKNRLAILPITRGDYVISHFEAYQPFPVMDKSICHVAWPTNILSLDPNDIPSETIAINCALASGILSDFLEDSDFYPTVSGRMKSGCFQFGIQNSRTQTQMPITVNNSQIEIDAAFEGINSLTLIEAKRDIADDFLIRQLYYPYRVWNNRFPKKVKPVFLVYSNGIFTLYEYEFQDPSSYNSLVLVKQKNYAIEDTSITLLDLQNISAHVQCIQEPRISFPQADRFERVINICELLCDHELNRQQVTDKYAFDVRQTNYYTDAARYLGLLEKCNNADDQKPTYTLSEQGKCVMHLNYKQRQLALCKLILQHRAFKDTFDLWLQTGAIPSKGEIVSIMKRSGLYRVESESTFVRRASTISGWLTWMLNLVKE